ncbi:PH domain-containing protein DDB_G0287875-like isoform X2 [Pocillopora damicornis]|uniref:PH domain-containing protein DDB_G0287875-like isoform X2 n=1 Tax=Pocillopora damicornis TaxID=46731 RepID=UPI000F54FBE7|nr:PH domain-containing protein DDB_G0287875-like isoform X2 [Pocillopora damicornis]
MMRNSNTSSVTRQVHFANGFPPKGLVQAVVPYQQSTSAVKHYVSLDEVSPGQIRRTHRTIPPLAMGRGQFCSIRARPEDERYKRRPDPFKLPKAAEKTGFSASQIKHAKPRILRACHSTEPATPSPVTTPVYDVRYSTRRTVYSNPPNRPQESDLEDNFVLPAELNSKNNKIISDVESQTIQAELAGLEEVYQRVCHGRIESLHSLMYPSRRDTKKGLVQYINTSAPVQLRTPQISRYSKKAPAAKNLKYKVETDTAETNDMGETKNGELQGSSSAPDIENKRNNDRPILIPLPYVRSDVSLTTITKQQTYHVPYMYSSRNTQAVLRQPSTLSNTAVPAVINFNPMNIPELPHSGAKNSIPSRGVVTVTLTNKSSNNTENVGHNPMPAPYVSPSPFKGTTPSQTPATPALVVGRSDMLNKLEVESVDSEVDYSAHGVQESLTNNQREEKIASNQTEDAASKNLDKEMVASEIRLSVTTEGGLQGGVEIYDYTKRDIESERQAAKHLEEFEKIGEKHIKEYNDLLEEHQHILDEVKQLEQELRKEEIQ